MKLFLTESTLLKRQTVKTKKCLSLAQGVFWELWVGIVVMISKAHHQEWSEALVVEVAVTMEWIQQLG